MTQKLIIKGTMTDLNTYINAERRHYTKAAKIKKEETQRVWADCKNQRIRKFDKPVTILYRFFCPNKRKDKDNIAFARKFINDGLYMANVIPNDGWNNIAEMIEQFEIDAENPRIEVIIDDE